MKNDLSSRFRIYLREWLLCYEGLAVKIQKPITEFPPSIHLTLACGRNSDMVAIRIPKQICLCSHRKGRVNAKKLTPIFATTTRTQACKPAFFVAINGPLMTGIRDLINRWVELCNHNRLHTESSLPKLFGYFYCSRSTFDDSLRRSIEVSYKLKSLMAHPRYGTYFARFKSLQQT